jgi:uncharacterized protein involved in outer membrane biogenesis
MSRRVLAIVLLAAFVLLGLGAVAAFRLLDAGELLAGRLSAMTGREVTIEKPVKLRLGLGPGLHVEGVRVGESAEGSPLRSVYVGRLDLTFELLPLVCGHLELRRLEVDDVDMVIEPAVGDDDEHAESRASGARPYSVRHADVRNLRVQLRRGGGAKTIASIERASLRSRDEAGEIDLELRGAVDRVDFDLSGSYNRSPLPSGEADGATLTLDGQVAGARVSGRGSLKDENGALSIALPFRADAPHLQIFSGVAQRELPELGPVRALGRLQVHGGTVGVSDLDVRVGDRKTAWLELTGYVRDLRNRSSFALASDFGVADVRSLGPLVGDPPHIGTVIGKASIHDRSGAPKIEKFTLKGGLPGVLEIDAEGQFENVRGVNGLDARVDLKARDLESIGEFFRRAFPKIGPVEFRGNVTAEAGEVTAEDVRGRLARTGFQGAFSATLQREPRPAFRGTIRVPELYLEDIGMTSGSAAEPTASERAEDTPPRRLLTDERFDVAWLQLADGKLSLHVDRMIGSTGPMAHDVQFNAGLQNGKLSLGNVIFGYGTDVAGQGEFVLDSRASPPTVSLRGEVKGMDLGNFLEQLGLPRAYSGRLDANVDLQTGGDSPHALASHLDGELSLTCGGGTIDAKYQSLLMRDLYRSVRSVLGEDRAEAPFNCLIVGLEFGGGVGSLRPLVIDADDSTTLGEGQIDLGAETIQLRLVPKPRKASLLSTAATVQVAGPLTRPKVKIEKRSLVTSTTKAIFGNVTSAPGVRQVWERLGRSAPVGSPCAKLLGSAH